MLESFVKLRLKSLSENSDFQPYPELEDRSRKALSEKLDLASISGRSELFDQYGEASAGLVFHYSKRSFFGEPIFELNLDCNMRNSEAVAWIIDRISQLSHSLQNRNNLTVARNVVCFLHASNLELLPHLQTCGFGIESIMLRGYVSAALERLQKKSDLCALLEPLNVRCHLLSTEDEVVKIGNLSRSFFNAHPEFCWFGGNDEVVERDAQELRAALEGKNPSHFVLKKETEVLGYFGFTTQVDAAQLGVQAGMTLLLNESLQGKGLARAIYWKLLQIMEAQQVTAFRGATSQPAVIALGVEMGRNMQMVILRKGADAFSRAHFAPYL